MDTIKAVTASAKPAENSSLAIDLHLRLALVEYGNISVPVWANDVLERDECPCWPLVRGQWRTLLCSFDYDFGSANAKPRKNAMGVAHRD
jgi:hypothetical protein